MPFTQLSSGFFILMVHSGEIGTCNEPASNRDIFNSNKPVARLNKHCRHFRNDAKICWVNSRNRRFDAEVINLLG